MTNIVRNTMKFLVPLTLESTKNDDISGRSVIPFYINPQSFQINSGKLINETLTKGGYVIQYWGEKMDDITVQGTTGSGGIEAINILHAVYRHEQIKFQEILIERARKIAEAATSEISNTSSATAGAGFSSIVDTITGGGFSSITDGISSTIEAVVNAFEGLTSDAVRVELLPTLAAFAVSMDLDFQGERYRGYFTSFTVSENAASPGLFDYTFNFKSYKRRGRRSNFMPWHRKPTDSNNTPVESQIPKSRGTAGLSFRSGFVEQKELDTEVSSDQSAKIDATRVSLSRSNLVKS